ncbi:MAG: aminoacyl-tRNA hydrolase [Planctomycetota bacterium]|nr:MAG: aminoacyl-tRNA hydrolase [Planctomycetota bacterium]
MQRRPDGRWQLAPGATVADQALQWQCTASGGPGGQHVNTTHSAVILHCSLHAIAGLDAAAQQRLRRLAGTRLRNDDVLVLRCDQSRSQHSNRHSLLLRLSELVQQARIRPKTRRPTKPGRGAVERRIEAKKQLGQRKQRRRQAGKGQQDGW